MNSHAPSYRGYCDSAVVSNVRARLRATVTAAAFEPTQGRIDSRCPHASPVAGSSSPTTVDSDVAVALGVMTGIDAADDATRKSEGRFETDYTQYLDARALEGARIGIARDFLG